MRRPIVVTRSRPAMRLFDSTPCTTAGGAQQCYNGLPTIRRKTQWAMANAGGIINLAEEFVAKAQRG